MGKIIPQIRKGSRYDIASMHAIELIALADSSDPFAAGRLALHLSNGIENDPTAIANACETILSQRKAQTLARYEKWKADYNAVYSKPKKQEAA